MPNKILGVEFRVGFLHPHFGNRQFEIFLHPTDLPLPLIGGGGQTNFNVTIHTSHGDVNSQTTTIPDYDGFPPHEQIKLSWDQFVHRVTR